MKWLKARPIFRLVSFDHSLVLAPWCLVRSSEAPLFRVRRIAHLIEQRDLPRYGVIETVLAGGIYLATSLRQVFIVWREQGAGVKRHYGVGWLRQLRDLLRITWRGNLPPRVYYAQRLFRQGDPAAQLAPIDHRELQLLLRTVHAGAPCPMLENKLAFRAFCAGHDLPTPPIVAVYESGQPRAAPDAGFDQARDLFSKPACGYSSHGVARWRCLGPGAGYVHGKLRLDRAGLEAWFAQQSREHLLIVQPRLSNSAALRPITGSALANCRIVTARRLDGSIGVLLASFRMGVGNVITSDDPAVSFCAAVDLATGKLHAGESKRADQGSSTYHPDTGARIAGFALPHWPEMTALALRAHAALPQMVFVGWDVVDTDRGLMLLEGNLVWGGNLAQMSGNRPLGLTEFPEIFLHHYLRRNPARR